MVASKPGATRCSHDRPVASLGVPPGPGGIAIDSHRCYGGAEWRVTSRAIRGPSHGVLTVRLMRRGRPRTTIGTFGDFTYIAAANGKAKVRGRFRDDDGRGRRRLRKSLTLDPMPAGDPILRRASPCMRSLPA
jgi:hypothetical protein